MADTTGAREARVRAIFKESAAAHEAAAEALGAGVAAAAEAVTDALRQGRKILLCGNFCNTCEP